MLHGGAVERSHGLVEDRRADLAVVAQHLHLDELVGEKGQVDLVQHLGGEAVLADHDDGLEVMRLGAQVAALGGGKGVHGPKCTWMRRA